MDKEKEDKSDEGCLGDKSGRDSGDEIVPDSCQFSVPVGQSNTERLILDGDFLPAHFRTMSYVLAKDTVRYVSWGDDAGLPANNTCSIMRSLVDDTLKDRYEMMKTLVSTLDVRDREQLNLVTSIANSLFEDEDVNWGRIVTLHTFCGFLAKHLEETIIPDCADDIAKLLGDFVVNRLGLWIVAHGGWKSFEQQFPSVCAWAPDGLWKGVIIVSVIVGAMVFFYSSMRYFGTSSSK